MAYLMSRKQREEIDLIYFQEKDLSTERLEQKCETFPQPHFISYIQPELIVASENTTDEKKEKLKIYIPPKTDHQKRENRKNKRGRKHGRNKSHIKH